MCEYIYIYIYIYILKVCNIILRKILSLKSFFFLFPVWLYILHFTFLYLLSTLYIYISLISIHIFLYLLSTSPHPDLCRGRWLCGKYQSTPLPLGSGCLWPMAVTCRRWGRARG